MSLRKYDNFDLSRDYRIEVLRDFLGGATSSRVSMLSTFWSDGPCRYEDINIFVLSRDRMFFVSRDFEGGVPSSKVTTLVSLRFMGLVKVQI